jgi:hypothetical protein
MNFSKLKFYALLIAIMLPLAPQGNIDAQGSTAMISVPVSGQILLEYDRYTKILLLDAFSGNVQPLVNDGHM